MSSSEHPTGPTGPNGSPDGGGLDRRQEPEAVPALARPETPPPIEPPRPGRSRPEPEASRLTRKQKKQIKDAHRPLDAWERYRALTDVIEEAIDLVDLADHKARFALVIMATLNVVLFFVGMRTDILRDIPSRFQPLIGVYLLVYVFVALYFFMQAIESLRPRRSQPQVPSVAQTGLEDFPLGIRFYEDVLRRNPEEYTRAWKEVRMGQLNAELALQSHGLAGINHKKYAALRRLYRGLKIMTVLAVGLVGLAAAATVVGTARKASEELARGARILGPAERIDRPGVKEPSGVAYHPGTDSLWVVGDEGALAQLGLDGKVRHQEKVEAQLEDVVAHPSGLLVFVSETRAELITYDPVARRQLARFPLDVGSLLSRMPGDRNQGFEGLAFRPQQGRPGGGVFYLAHQRSPSAVVAISFDPTAPPRRLGVESGVARWDFPNFQDLTAITYVPTLDRLLVLAGAKDLLLVLNPQTGGIEDEIPVPGQQQEGLAFDPSGTLWIADDADKSLLRMPEALEGLTRRRAEGRAAEPSPAPISAADPSGLLVP